MNVPPLSFMEENNDRDKLIGFIWWLQQFLDSLVQETQSATTDTPLFSPDLPKEIRHAITIAWKEINNGRKVFYQVADIQKDIPIAKLAEAGLTGPELSLKFHVLRWISGRFGSRQSPAWLRRLIKSADDILDSIASVNPVAHGIKEFKDTLSSLTWD